MSEPFQTQKRTWPKKFRDAFRGMGIGVRGQPSFVIHFVAMALVILAGIVVRVSLIEWCVLTLCIAIVLAAETFNSSLETMAKAVDDGENNHLRDALDISSAAVLFAAIGATVAGGVVLAARFGRFVEWW